MTKRDFLFKKLTIGWCVVRSDAALIAVGFPSKKAASEWFDAQWAQLSDPS